MIKHSLTAVSHFSSGAVSLFKVLLHTSDKLVQSWLLLWLLLPPQLILTVLFVCLRDNDGLGLFNQSEYLLLTITKVPCGHLTNLCPQ